MSELDKQVSQLSPAKRALLELRRKQAEKRSLPAPPIKARGQRERTPLSFAQQRLWLIYQLDPASHLYNVPRAICMKGVLDLAALQNSLNRLVERHEILRTVFPIFDDEPQQLVLPATSVELPVVDLTGLPAEARQSEAIRLAMQEYHKSFDLVQGPILRARLLRLDQDDHVLVVVMHHIASDGWTGGLFFEELGALYGALSQGKEPELAPLPVQYADFAVWQREWLQGSVLEEELSYWRRHLEDAPAVLELPTDRPRGQSPAYRGSRRSTLVSKDVLDLLKAVSRQHNTTLFATFLAGLKIILSRWTGQDDVVIGTVSANRNQTEIEKLIGCFVNFLPLRDRVPGDATADQFLESVKQTVLGSHAHQECPFEKIIEAVNPQRALNVNPLYSVALLVQNFPEIAFRSDRLEARFLDLPLDVAFLDLRFMAAEIAEGLQIDCEFSTELFDASTIDLLLAAYADTLKVLASDAKRKIAEFPLPPALISQAEAAHRRQEKQTIAVAATFTAEPIEPSLRFWMQQLGSPARIEFAPFNQVFQELLNPASTLAQNRQGYNLILLRLEDWHGSAETWDSGQQLENSVHEFIAAANAAVHRFSIPLLVCLCPPSHSIARDPERNRFFREMEQLIADELGETPGAHVITSEQLMRLYPVVDYEDEYSDRIGHIPYTAALFTALGTLVARRVHALRRPPAKVIVLDCDETLWRGVCGEVGPLGVVIDDSCRALQQFMVAQHQAGMLLCLCSKNSEEDVFNVFQQNAGMVLKQEHLLSWRVNWQAKSANLLEMADELQLGLDSFVFLDDNAVECAEVRANCPQVLTLELPRDPRQLASFLQHVWAFDHWKVTQEDNQRTELYRQNIGREQVRKAAVTLDDFLAGLDLKIDIRPASTADLDRVSQLTERTNQFNCTTIRRSVQEIEKLRHSGSQCLVVDVKDRFGDYGLVGVVIFSVAADVLNVDTFLLSCRALGRKVEHHMLRHLGEIANQHGCRSVRINFRRSRKNRPAEDFLEAVGAAYRAESGTEVLYDVPTDSARAVLATSSGENTEPDQRKLKTADSASSKEAASSDHQVIIRIARELRDVSEIARAIEGEDKLRRRSQGAGFIAPHTPTEEVLAGIWSRLLRVDKISRHDDFFALGGHSLAATQVLARVRQAFGVELPLRCVFENATVAGLAARIDQQLRGTSNTEDLPKLVPYSRMEPIPLSFGQQRLWFLHQLDSDTAIYNIPQIFRVTGKLDVAALEQSVNELVRRHESLRTTFRVESENPVQIIADELFIPLEVTDLTQLPLAERESTAERLLKQSAHQAFDLSKGPLVRTHLLRLASDEHRFLLAIHHIVSDRWSMGVMAEELAELYSAFAEKRPSPLPELPIQYGDYSAWQRQWLQTNSAAKQTAYWKQHLDGAPAVLELPTSRPRPPAQTYRGATVSRLLSNDLLRRLRSFSNSEGVTLFMTLLAAFQTLLARYSGQDDVVVGSPIANRSQAELERLIGFFVNTLALRTDLSGNPSVRELLARVREVSLNAYGNQDVPFEKLVEELHPERSLSHNPVFQVLFALQNAPMQTLELAGLQLQRMASYTDTAMFDMSWFAIEVGDGLMIRAEYNTDLFDQDVLERALGHFQILLEAMIAQPQAPIYELPLLSEQEHSQVLVEFNATAAEYPQDVVLHTLFEQQVERTPNATALVSGNDRITYADLNARANQLAHFLARRGVRPEVLVAICTERSIDMLVGILGILKAGGAYVPLDPAYPKERLRWILEDAGAPFLLTQESLRGNLPEHQSELICVDSDWSRIANEPVNNPACPVTRDNVAYVLFTSGSTGRPKGVQVEHGNLVNFLCTMKREPGFKANDVLLAVTTLSFDIAGLELYLPLVSGGTVVLASHDEAIDAIQLMRRMRQWNVTVMQATPATWHMLLAAGWQGDPNLKVLCGGEALPPELAEQLVPRCAELWNMYGPTETTIWSSIYRVPAGIRGAAPIGKPIGNTQMYVLDRNRRPVPLGVVGELYIGGDGVARGYLNRPELTAKKFVADPFRATPGARLYRTGDLALYLPDGNLLFLGRGDTQVKLRGFRIELGEVESVLVQHSAIKQAVALVREDVPGDKRLIAYVVPAAGQSPEPAALRAHLKDHLPEYMIPAAFVVLEALPLTPNGKVDRRALPRPEYKEAAKQEEVAPRTELEAQLAKIWCEVLRIPSIGVHDNFFRMGGHSLLATQVVSRISKSLQLELPLRSLFECPTISEMAVQLKNQQARTATPANIRRVPRDGQLPLSFAQQRLWFLDQLEPNSPSYNIPWTLRVTGKLNVDALQTGLNRLVARHESLRTTFANHDGDPVQVIRPSLKLDVQQVSLEHLSVDDRRAEARRLVVEEANRPFNLSRGPLLRATLLRLEAEEHILLINIHHIVSDRWSMGIFSQELAALYAAAAEQRPDSLPELPVQYADFAVWQREWLSGDVLQNELAYWKEQLKDAPPVLELPTDRPRPAVESSRGEIARTQFSKHLTDRLNALSQAEGGTLFITLLAAFNALLSRYSGQDDIVVGMPIAGRNQAETEGLIGFFANTLPLRVTLSGDPTFRELLNRAKEVALGAYAHQGMPFEKLVEELRPERSLSHNPLVQVFFVLQNAPMEALQLSGLQLQPIESGTNTAKGDMFFSLVETAEGLRGRVEYSTDLFDASTIERMLDHYTVLLEAAVSNPDLRVSELPLLTRTEYQQVVVDWNATAFDYPRHFCLHQVFEQQAERTPDAIACIFANQQITYRALNQRANQVAHFLRKHGAAPGKRVGIYVERSLDMMVGLLGIQKSGAAYVPLDPAYPAERVRLTLEDAQVPILLTQESLLASLLEHRAQIICLDSNWEAIAQEDTSNPHSQVCPEDLIYVIFTSGSTGRPKGVQVPHLAVVNLLAFMAKELEIGMGDVIPALASFAFDMCIPELYLALTTGACVLIGHKDLAGNGEELADVLRRHGATMVHATPSTWSLLLDAGFSGEGLKRVIGAEPVPQELCNRLLEADPSLYNFYGPTETTVWSAFHRFRAPGERVVVGRPLANTQIYILDKKLQPTPIGVPGEIHIGGDGVAFGYLNRPELTAEKFIADPFDKTPGATMYKTGDVGRFLADGRIEFQGRADNQVKVRGYRIELGEIETVLNQHGSVQDCVVVAREDVAGDKRLVGYVVPFTGDTVDASELRTWVKSRLPEYMVPVAFVAMERLPLSPNGKVDRRNLPVPDYARPEVDGAYVGARTATEELVASIWTEVLKLDRVGAHDNFFELGGHSLLATQVIARIRQTFKLELPVRALFEAPTVAGLTGRVESLARGGRSHIAPTLKHLPRGQHLRLSFAQQRLWFLDQLEPNNPLYNVPFIVRLNGPLNLDAVDWSLQQIVARHETLRTTFTTVNDEPVQVIAPELTLPLDVRDLRGVPEHELLSHARQLATEEVKRPFNLSQGPLVRATLLRLGEQDHVLILNTHHIISDRWSIGVLSQELANLYEAYLNGKPSPLPDLAIQYADYAAWQRQYLSEPVLEQQLGYWKKQLDGAPAVLELRTDRPRNAVESFWGGVHSQALPEELTHALRKLSRSHSATFFMTLMAAFNVLLARYAGQEDVVVGTDLANRTQLETEKLIGFFVNLLPIRTRLSPEISFAELLDRVRETALGAFAHQDIPFEKLVEELRPERNLTHNPLVQVLFVMQNTPQPVREFGGLQVGPLGVSSTSRFDLVLFINDPEGAPVTTWMYNPNLFEASSIERMATLYEAILAQVASNPGVLVQGLYEAMGSVEAKLRGAEQREFQAASRQKLKNIKRRAVSESST